MSSIRGKLFNFIFIKHFCKHVSFLCSNSILIFSGQISRFFRFIFDYIAQGFLLTPFHLKYRLLAPTSKILKRPPDGLKDVNESLLTSQLGDDKTLAVSFVWIQQPQTMQKLTMSILKYKNKV